MSKGVRALIGEAIAAHLKYAAERPWMPTPNPIIVDVGDLQAMLAEIDAQQTLLIRARNLLSHPTYWAAENAKSRWALSEEITEACA